MYKSLALLAATVGTAAAFAPASQNARASVAVQETKADLEVLANELNPILGFYDPLNLAEGEFWDNTNEATIGFLRQAEIKHGRVAMLAFTGALVQSYGMHFDGKMNGMFYEKGVNPFEVSFRRLI